MEATQSADPSRTESIVFSNEELTEIIRRAAEKARRPGETTVTYEEMLAVGEELGFEASDLQAAASDVASGRSRKKRVIRQKLEFFHHLISYVTVMGGLFLINLVTSPGYFWVVFPAIGWGIGLTSHAGRIYLNEKAALLGVEEVETCSRHEQRRAGRKARMEGRRQRRFERHQRRREVL